MNSTVSLPPHHLKLALLQPQIAPNTGNIARLAVATSTELHLVRPLGFALTDRQLKRSAMDYWPRLKLTMHDDTDSFFCWSAGQRMWLFTSKSSQNLWQTDFHNGDILIFGNETCLASVARLIERYLRLHYSHRPSRWRALSESLHSRRHRALRSASPNRAKTRPKMKRPDMN